MTKCQQSNMATKVRKKKAVAILVLLELDKEQEKNEQLRKVWARPWIARREQKGCFHQVFIGFFTVYNSFLDLPNLLQVYFHNFPIVLSM